ncbi:FAD-dependent oxidoreductase [Clostridia bacterium]|nr:FAD-dependent oxidoreductase [Clostridia bacterium]
MAKVIIVGAGAAGLFAAAIVAANGHQTELYEKNGVPGKKLLITGKGRCNLTNSCEKENFFQAVVSNPKFLYSAINRFDQNQFLSYLREIGLKTKIERGNRVFPESDKSSDVVSVLVKQCRRFGVKFHYHSKVDKLYSSDHCCKGIILSDGTKIQSDAVILACGGLSYPTTGSTGEGYTLAKEIGHHIVETLPALVPIETKENWVKDVQGLSLKNVRIQIFAKNSEREKKRKILYEDFGEMLFTHFGVSGPVILSASSHIGRLLKTEELILAIDLKPALSDKQLDLRFLREFEQHRNQLVSRVLRTLYPQKLIPILMKKTKIALDRRAYSLLAEEREALLFHTKEFCLTLHKLRDYREAVITQGGVCVQEISPSTMESKKISRLYMIGEMLDLDAKTGGFNLQIAWSTAYAAAMSI